MRKLILGFCCLAFASPAWAQTPVSPGAIQDANLLPIQHVLHHGGACNDNCGGRTCVSVPSTKVHTKTIFCSKCIEYCLPRCSLLHGGGCDSCADNCGPIRTKNVLLKKVVTTECPSTKCVPGDGCVSGGGGIFHHRSGGVSGTPVEVIPTAPMPKK
jgi:hypothetical protein